MESAAGDRLQEALRELREQWRSSSASASTSNRATPPPASPPPSTSSPRESAADQKHRLALLTQFFSVYPQSGGDKTVEMRLMTYHGELADIHVELLGMALRRLIRTQPGAFMPEIYAVRRAAAIVLANLRAGRPAIGSPSQEPAREPDVERVIQTAPKPGQAFNVPLLAAVAGP